MIYTIGFTENYERYFLEIPNLKKKGRDADYTGGAVFATKEQAEQYLRRRGIESTYSVYGVEADWDKDTEKAFDDEGEKYPYNYLKQDALLLKL